MENIKVISLNQPWATLVVAGAKKWETRGWKTKHRGLLYIHSSTKFPDAYKALCLKWPFDKFIGDFNMLPLGKIIGCVELKDIITTEKWLSTHDENNFDDNREYHFGNYGPNRYAWELVNPVLFSIPTMAKGSLNVWEFEKEKLLSHE
jgi:hypothetical protein